MDEGLKAYAHIREHLFEEPDLRIGKYRLIREIGRGGMGVVYEAEDSDLGRRIALKVLRESGRAVTRLRREAAITARMRHPNIVSIHEIGVFEDRLGSPSHYIAMDLIEGRTLADVLSRDPPPRSALLRILEEVSRTAGYAHRKGVVHRDLKPENVMVDDEGHVFLTDFGLAQWRAVFTRLTQSQAILGTPHYMAPEQVRGSTGLIGPPTDVYALGVVLYHILTRRMPFEAQTVGSLYEAVLRRDPPPPTQIDARIPRDLEAICLKAMEKNPIHRYSDAYAFADDLRRFRDGEPVRARRFSWGRWIAKKIARRRTAILLSIVAALGCASWGGWISAQDRRRERHLRDRREAALRRLSVARNAIEEGHRGLRQARVPPQQARRELEEAVRGADSHVREWPRDPVGYYVRARGKMYLGDLEGARRDLETAVGGSPDFRPGWSLLGMVRIEEFQQLYVPRRAFEKRQRERAAVLQRATEAFGKGWEFGREIAESEKWGLAWTREDRAIAVLGRGLRLYYELGAPDEAFRLFEDELRSLASEEFASWLGTWSGDPEENIRRQTRALALAPGYLRALVERAGAKKRRGDLAGSIADYDAALAVDPQSAVARLGRGLARQERGDLAGAVEDYDRALEIRGDLAEVLNNRGLAWHRRGDLGRAIADYNGAIALEASFAEAYYNRSLAHVEAGYDAAALVDVSRTIAIQPDDAQAYSLRGRIRQRLGDSEGAVADFGAALRLCPAASNARKRIRTR